MHQNKRQLSADVENHLQGRDTAARVQLLAYATAHRKSNRVSAPMALTNTFHLQRFWVLFFFFFLPEHLIFIQLYLCHLYVSAATAENCLF